MGANKADTKEFASNIRVILNSTNQDFVKWSKEEHPPDGFSDQTNVLGSVLGSDKKKVAKWNDDYNFFRSFVKHRDKLKNIESRLDDLIPDYTEIFDELRNYNENLNALRKELENRGGELSSENLVTPSPGSYKPPPPPSLKGISFGNALLIIGAASLAGGGIGYYMKKQRNKAFSSPSLSMSQGAYRLMRY